MATKDRFPEMYEGRPPWEIGGSQPELLRAFDELAPVGSVLDLGCGTGEHVLELVRRGCEAWGLDSTAAAIEQARAKAAERGLEATFVVGDALELGGLGRTFDWVLDSGLFHVLDDEERRRYLAELPQVLPVGGRHLMLGFGRDPVRQVGPQGYDAGELRAFFAGWEEELLRPASFEATTVHGPVQGWLSVFRRV